MMLLISDDGCLMVSLHLRCTLSRFAWRELSTGHFNGNCFNQGLNTQLRWDCLLYGESSLTLRNTRCAFWLQGGAAVAGITHRLILHNYHNIANAISRKA